MSIYTLAQTRLLTSLPENEEDRWEDPHAWLRSDNDQQPSLRSDNDQQPSLRSDNDQQPWLRSDNDQQPSLRSDNDQQPWLRSDNDQQPSLRSDNDQQPWLRSDNDQQPSLRSDNDQQPWLRSDNDQQPWLRSDNDQQPWLRSDNDQQPWLRSHNDPHYRHRHKGWLWRWRKTTPRPTKPTTRTTPPPDPEICQNRKIVTRIVDEPGPVVCLRKNVTEMMAQLKTIGGPIKRYAAVRVIDACGFVDLTNIEKPSATQPPTSPSMPSRNITLRRREADAQQSDVELQRRKRTLPTSPGTVFRGCQGRGTIIDGTSEHRLCTECAATTRLGNDRFPMYINEVVCRDSDVQCAAKMGLCFQRSLKLPFLRSIGKFQFDPFLSATSGKTVYKEIWEEYTQEIRSCCECGMFSSIYNKIASSSDD